MSSIRNRVLIALLVAGLIPLLVILFITQTLTRRAIQESQYDQMSEFTEEVGRNVTGFVESAYRDLMSLTTNQIIRKRFDEVASWTETERQVEYEKFLAEKQAEFDRAVLGYSDFYDITLYDSEGSYIASTSSPEIDNLGFRVDASVEHANAVAGKTNVSRPRIRDSGEIPDEESPPKIEIAFYLPLIQELDNSFVVHASFKFGKIWGFLDAAQMGLTGHFVLLDSFNNVLYHPNKPRIFDPAKFDGSNSVDHWLSNPIGIYEDYVYAVQQLYPYESSHDQSIPFETQNEEWVLVGLKTIEEANKLVLENSNRTLFAGLGTLCVALIIGVWLSRKLSEPVTQLSQATRKVSRGELSTYIPEIGPREMKHLARDFNQMVGELRQHREGLEELVSMRTSDLKESQDQLSNLTAQLQASYDSTREAILVVKLDGRVLTANRRFDELFGLEGTIGACVGELNETIGSCFREPDRFKIHWNQCNDSLTQLEEQEWEIVSPREIIVSIYSAPVRSTSSKPIARLWMFRDITDQRHLEEARAREEDRVRKELKRKEEALKEVHHRIKNSLSVVSSLIAHRSREDSHSRLVMNELQSRIAVMALMHEQLYKSRELDRVDAPSFIQELINLIRRAYADMSGSVNVSLEVDVVNLEMQVASPCALIIHELVSNAMKYAFPDMQSGQIRVGLKCDKENFRLVISDNGIGISNCAEKGYGLKLFSASPQFSIY